MRIALVVHDFHQRGGHARYTFELARQLSDRHEVRVFANTHESGATPTWSYTHVRAFRQTALSTVFSFPIALRAHARSLAGFDVRHAQGYVGGRPNVVTAHICVEAFRTSLDQPALRTRGSLAAMELVERRFYRAFDGKIIAISKRVANDLRTLYGAQAPIEVISHGVDTERFHPAVRNNRAQIRRELGIDDATFVLLYVGDLAKSHKKLRELAARLVSSTLVVITGSKRYAFEAPNARFVTTNSAIERYYGMADAFVFPTTYDAFGMVVLEAMACGLPVFSSDQAGAAELIEDGSNGFVSPLETWVERTANQIDDTELLKKVGDRAASFAATRGWRPVVEQVEAIYKSTL